MFFKQEVQRGKHKEVQYRYTGKYKIIAEYYSIIDCRIDGMKLKTNNTKTNNPSWGQYSGSPGDTSPMYL